MIITEDETMLSKKLNQLKAILESIHSNARFDENRNEIQATLEVLQFLRNWVTSPAHFTIYTNSQYCITCVDKWIPNWITKGFRIGHTGQMRPNSDLLVKLHAFGTCMDFDLIQHYDDYETYHHVVSQIPKESNLCAQ